MQFFSLMYYIYILILVLNLLYIVKIDFLKQVYNNTLVYNSFIMDHIQNIINQGQITEEKIVYDENIPEELIHIYSVVGHNNKLILNEWQILTFTETHHYNDEYLTKGCEGLYTFAFSYSGLGWIKLATVDLDKGGVFVRYDGGSNGYDSEANLQRTLNYRKDFKKNKYGKKLITVKKFLDLCIKDENQEMDNLMLW
jgi:hypothetical protein